MTPGDALRATALVFIAGLLQATVASTIFVFGGTTDILLVVVVVLGLLRGSVPGAVFGFGGGLVVDTLTLDTLGFTSLVLTLAGFWAGRYGETTGRGRALAPLVAVGVITVLAEVFAFALHYMLGEDVVARQALVSALLPAIFLNLALAFPVHRFVRRLIGERTVLEPAAEVELVV
jgi:rod shape-determining protein MreD